MEESAEDNCLNKLQILQPLLQIPCHIIHHNLQKKNIFASKEKNICLWKRKYKT